MNTTPVGLLILIATIAMFTGATADSTFTKETKLVKINEKRIPMKPIYSTLCRRQSKEEISPHSYAEIDLFTNQIALKYRKEHPTKIVYPVGSVFVKKKYSSQNAKEADRATIMVKKKNEGKITDWKFTLVKLPGYTPVDLNGAKNCITCHENFKDQGYVSKVSENLLRKHLQSKDDSK